MRKPTSLVAVLATACVLLLACAAYFQYVVKQSVARIEQLDASERIRVTNAISNVADLFDEHDTFVTFRDRKGHATQDGLPFADRCLRELMAFANDPVHETIVPDMVAEALHRAAQLSIAAGNRKQAADQLSRALAIAERVNDVRRQGLAGNTLGVLLFEMGRLDDAIAQFQRSSNALRSVPAEKEVWSLVLRNWGCASRAKGTTDPELFEQAISVLGPVTRQLEPAAEIRIDARVMRADAFVATGNISQAASELRTASDELQSLMILAETADFEDDVISHRQYRKANVLLQDYLLRLQDSPTALSLNLEWQWLFQKLTEVADVNWLTPITMCGEFEVQTGLVVPWTDYPWANRIAQSVIKNAWESIDISVLVAGEEDYDDAVKTLAAASVPIEALTFHFARTDSPWLRDFGPIVAKSARGDSVWIDSHIVREGFKQRVEADALPRRLGNTWRTTLLGSALSLEGGAILSNGRGLTVLSSAVVDFNEAFGFDGRQIDAELRRITGAKQLVYLDPLDGEPTHHIDMFMTFISPTTVVVGEYADKSDRNARILDVNAKRLSLTQVGGVPLQVIRMPMPRVEAEQFKTYTNVIFANGVLLVPSWPTSTPAMEAEVRQIYESLLPNWKVVFVNCGDLATRGGALHCLTVNLGTAKRLTALGLRATGT